MRIAGKIFRRLRHIFIPSWYYYRWVYRKKILLSKSLVCDDACEFEIHIVTSNRDFLDSLWAVKTFCFFSKTTPRLVVHDDGSLNPQQVERLSQHFVGAQVIRRSLADAEMAHYLDGFPHARSFRAQPSFYCALKLLDLLKYSKKNNILIIDSDLLFFENPAELLECITKNLPCFMRDYQNFYSSQGVQFLKSRGIRLTPRLNAGLLFIQRDFYETHLAAMDQYFKHMPAHHGITALNRHEQTLHAMLSARSGARPLSEQYQISDDQLSERSVCHHFVTDGSRSRFYFDGLRRLHRKRFLELLSRPEEGLPAPH